MLILFGSCLPSVDRRRPRPGKGGNEKRSVKADRLPIPSRIAPANGTGYLLVCQTVTHRFFAGQIYRGIRTVRVICAPINGQGDGRALHMKHIESHTSSSESAIQYTKPIPEIPNINIDLPHMNKDPPHPIPKFLHPLQNTTRRSQQQANIPNSPVKCTLTL